MCSSARPGSAPGSRVDQRRDQGAICNGESNVGRDDQDRDLFPVMLTTWRDESGLGDTPFSRVRLARWARAQTAGAPGTACHSPLPKGMEQAGPKIVLSSDHVPTGGKAGGRSTRTSPSPSAMPGPTTRAAASIRPRDWPLTPFRTDDFPASPRRRCDCPNPGRPGSLTRPGRDPAGRPRPTGPERRL